jgi:hypothetical protein
MANARKNINETTMNRSISNAYKLHSVSFHFAVTPSALMKLSDPFVGGIETLIFDPV